MDLAQDSNLSIYRICPDCKQDILTHKEATIFIKIHSEQIKREIESYKETYPPELFKNHIQAELQKFTSKAIELERKISSPLYKMNKQAHILLESWRNIIFIYKNELAPQNLVKNRQKKKTYLWLGKTNNDIPELYELMKGQLIINTTTLKQLKDIFTKQPIEKIKPVKWHDTNASELLYFILQLTELGLIEHSSNRTDYQKLMTCFIMPNGNRFTANFKELKQNILVTLSDEKQNAINELLRKFI